MAQIKGIFGSASSLDIDITPQSLFLAINLLEHISNGSSSVQSLSSGLKSIGGLSEGLQNSLNNYSVVFEARSAINSIFGDGVSGGSSLKELLGRLNKIKSLLGEDGQAFFKYMEENDVDLFFGEDLAFFEETDISSIVDYVNKFKAEFLKPLENGTTLHCTRDESGKILGYEFISSDYVSDGTGSMFVQLNGYGDGSTLYSSEVHAIYGAEDDLLDGMKMPSNSIFCFPRASSIANSVNSQKILDYVDYVSDKYNVDDNKISLSGFSDGGRGAIELLKLAPDKFSVVSIMGIDIQKHQYDALANAHCPVIFFDSKGGKNSTYMDSYGVSSNILVCDGVDFLHDDIPNMVSNSEYYNFICEFNKEKDYKLSSNRILLDSGNMRDTSFKNTKNSNSFSSGSSSGNDSSNFWVSEIVNSFNE